LIDFDPAPARQLTSDLVDPEAMELERAAL
jgi:hypothetical protein